MAAISSLVDNFDTNTFNSSLWTRSNATQVVVTNHELEISTTTTATYYTLDSVVTNYDLAGSAFICQLVNAGNQALASFETTFPTLIQNASNTIFWYINSGTLRAYKKVAGVQTQIGTGLTYNASVHKWFRIRESGGTTFWDYSTDGITWTNYVSTANPITVTALQVEISVGCFAVEASTTTAKIDNINAPPTHNLMLLGVGN